MNMKEKNFLKLQIIAFNDVKMFTGYTGNRSRKRLR